jgi:hypothetical protein
MQIFANDRLDFELLFRPNPGFLLDRVIICSYQLDASALLPIANAIQKWGPDGEFPGANRTCDLAGLERALCRVHAYCHGCRLNVPLHSKDVTSLFSSSINCVLQDSPFVHLHAKYLVLRYLRRSTPSYRFIVMSRNVLMERSWYCLFSCDGTIGLADNANGRAVSDLVSYLVVFADFKDSSRVLEELALTRFVPPPGYSDIAIRPFGLRNYSNPLFDLEADDLLIAVPLASPKLLAEVALRVKGERMLFSRLTTLADVPPDVRKLYLCYGLIEEYHAPPIEALGDERESQGFHMKLYVSRRGDETTVHLGSANLTEGAFNRNLELLIELKAQGSTFFEDTRRFLVETVAGDERFMLYTEALAVSPIGVSADLVRALRLLEHQLVHPKLTPIKATVVRDPPGGLTEIIVNIDMTRLRPCGDIEVGAWLIAIGSEPVPLVLGAHNRLIYKASQDLPQYHFLAFEVRAWGMEPSRFMTKVFVDSTPMLPEGLM